MNTGGFIDINRAASPDFGKILFAQRQFPYHSIDYNLTCHSCQHGLLLWISHISAIK
jgi:hypothetical protein